MADFNVRVGDFLFVSCFNQYVEVVEVLNSNNFRVREIFFDPRVIFVYLSNYLSISLFKLPK